MSTFPVPAAADRSTAPGGPYRTDRELLDAWVVDREHDALGALVHRYSTLVLSVCRRQCRDRHDTDDAFQATFLALARHAASVRHPDRLGGWLHRVAYRSACRARARGAHAPGALVEDPPDPRQPLDQITRRHQLRVLDEELAALPERYQTVVVLHLMEGRTLAQVARQTGTTTGAVRGRLQRGKQQLRRRLRCRGIVPGAAAATLAMWPTDSALAATAAQRFLEHVQPAGSAGGGDPPDTSSLEPLLQNGTASMTLYGMIGGGLAAVALLAAVIAGSGQPAGDAREPGAAIALTGVEGPPRLAQLRGTPTGEPAATQNGRTAEPPDDEPAPAEDRSGFGAAGGNFGMMQSTPSAGRAPSASAGSDLTLTAPASSVAQQVSRALDQPIAIDLPPTPLEQLPAQLTAQLGIPVLLDPRGAQMAEAAGSQVQLQAEGLPLRTALRRLLRPLGLRAVVEEDGLIITADMAELARRGIGTDQWINIDPAATERFETALAESTSAQFIEETLENVMRTLSQAHDIPIVIDRRALEELGLTSDVPISLEVSDISLRSVLQLILNDFDLTYTIAGETLQITTHEKAESDLLARVYWLDATGASDFDALMYSIQAMIEPDHWEALGGPGTMTPLLLQDRAALMVSATLSIHEQIERFLAVLRENHFGPDPAFGPSKPSNPPGMSGRGHGSPGMSGGGHGSPGMSGGMF